MNKFAFFKKVQVKHMIILILVATLAITLQAYFSSDGKQYTRYNNYVIFRQSFEHLLHHLNLYAGYKNEHYDLYKYSPTFALYMGLFYYLPDVIGLLLFNLAGICVFIVAIKKLRFANDSLKTLLLFLLLEICISLSSAQTNILIAGLIILAFCFMEDEQPLWATLCIVLTVYIKLFGIVAFSLWLLYPQKIRFVMYSIMWIVILGLLPLVSISRQDLIWQYRNWSDLLKMDHDASYGISFLGWLHGWFKLDLPKITTVLVAALVFLVPFIKKQLYTVYSFRLQILASILLWVVIFNHKGESPTYIIAMAGVAIWYFSQKATTGNTVLLLLCFVFTSCTSTDLITPGWVVNKYIEPYAIKAVFCSVVWFKLIIELLLMKPATKEYIQVPGAAQLIEPLGTN